VTVRPPSFPGRSVRRRLPGAAALALGALLTVPLPAQPPAPPASGGLQTGTVAGTVRDPSGVAVTGAQVSLVGILGRGSTASDGTFRLSAPVGERTLVVRRIGFRPESLAVSVRPGVVAEADVRLEPATQQLAPLVVEAGRPVYRGRLAAFNQRRDRGIGRFFTEEDIRQRNPQLVSDLLRTLPGTRISRRGGQMVVTFRNNNCTPLIWVDGAPAVAGYFDPDALNPESLAGIEIYSGPATVPVELDWVRGKAMCGAIALWTRVPEPNRRKPKRQVTAQELAALVASLRLYTEDQVDVPVAADTLDPVTPQYPDSLRRAGVEGHAMVEFVVDTTGLADMETFGSVLSTHPRFLEEARRAVGGARFTPAVKDGRRVRQLVQLTFRFVVPEQPEARPEERPETEP
jgi:TonB family protein